jgi:hypothetical protein
MSEKKKSGKRDQRLPDSPELIKKNGSPMEHHQLIDTNV